MLPAMKLKPTITIVGPGRLGRALGVALKRAGYKISEVVSREPGRSQRAARSLARAVDADAVTARVAQFDAKVIWFLVPDREIAPVARELAPLARWKGKIALHSSGALGSEELEVLRQLGASVASVHPFMTFVSQSLPSLEGVPFAMEGDRWAVRVAHGLVEAMGAEPFKIPRESKVLYHAWGAFTSPLLVSLLATAEQVARGRRFFSTRRREPGPLRSSARRSPIMRGWEEREVFQWSHCAGRRRGGAKTSGGVAGNSGGTRSVCGAGARGVAEPSDARSEKIEGTSRPRLRAAIQSSSHVCSSSA